MMNDPLHYLSADEALTLFASRALSPVELMEAVIHRAEEVQDTVNAFTFTHYDEAMDLARAAEARYMKDEPLGALDGLPIAVKDEGAIAGKPLSNGSLSMQGHVAQHTSPVNERVLGAGGIVHARTATPEFSCAAYTWSNRWGVTRNPWNTAFTPGGSSGGSAAALAAGMSTLATGSDIGGSIRIPASACGVVGLKPSYGRNPEEPPFNLDFFAHQGPLGRCVKDVALLQNVMSGPHPNDIATLRDKLVLDAGSGGLEGVRIAYSPDLGVFEVEPEVRRNTENALQVLRDLGATVEPVKLDWKPEWVQAGVQFLKLLFGRYIAHSLPDHAQDMTTYCREFAEDAKTISPEALLDCYEAIGHMYTTLGPVLERCDILICPTTGIPAVPADFDQTRDKLVINEREVEPPFGWTLTLPFNMLSRCPVISVPTGHAANGVPTGMQIVGRTYGDASVVRAAAAYERALSGWLQIGAEGPGFRSGVPA